VLKFLADENLDNDILRGLELRNPGLDILRVQDVGLSGAEDREVLEWAAQNGRAVVSDDRRTLAHFATQRVEARKKMPGLFLLRRKAPLGPVIDDLLLLAECSREGEWEGRILYLPLR